MSGRAIYGCYYHNYRFWRHLLQRDLYMLLDLMLRPLAIMVRLLRVLTPRLQEVMVHLLLAMGLSQRSPEQHNLAQELIHTELLCKLVAAFEFMGTRALPPQETETYGLVGDMSTSEATAVVSKLLNQTENQLQYA